MARARRRQPYDPSKAHDRRSTDLNRGIGQHVAPIEVDDPMELGGKLIVMRSTRDDPLGDLHARHMIDEAQYQAGRAFQRDFETAERGPRAIDPSKEAVDGGMMPEPITEAQRAAARQLAVVHRALGQNGSALIHNFLIHGLSMQRMALMRSLNVEAERKYLRARLRECLDSLAVIYGFAMGHGR